MQIIIDIPEDVYKRTVSHREFKNLNDCVTTIKALENGTPLSKESDIDNDYMTGYNCGYSDAIYDMSERSEEDADSN